MKELTMHNGTVHDKPPSENCDHLWLVLYETAGHGPTAWTCRDCSGITHEEPDTYQHPHEAHG